MAQATGKLVANYMRNESTTEFLMAVSRDMRISITSLVIASKVSGTFAHPLIALHFAQWCNPEFAVWAMKSIKTLIETGTVSIAPKTPLELAKEQVKLHEALELAAMQIKLLEEDNERQAEADDEYGDFFPHKILVKRQSYATGRRGLTSPPAPLPRRGEPNATGTTET